MFTPRKTRTLVGLALMVGCRDGRPPETPPGPPAATVEARLPAPVLRNRLRGVLVSPPQAAPDFRLTTTDGTAFDFRRDTKGALALLFFGYTHCPDVCPVHIANLGRVIKAMPMEDVARIKVVFVTTDPARDTPERLRNWLDNFHASFIGLVGTEEEIRQAQAAAGLIPAAREAPDSANPGAYFVSHAAQVIAFTSDGLAHVVYPFGVRQQDWANDLPILARGWPQ